MWALAAWLRPLVRILTAWPFLTGRTFPRHPPSWFLPGGGASGCQPCAARRLPSPHASRHLTHRAARDPASRR